MKTRFNWRTDEEDDAWTAGDTPLPRPLHRRSRLLLLPFVLAVLVVAILYWQQARRLRAEQEALEDEIVGNFELWQRAVATNDVELFLQQLSSDDPLWRNAQRQLFTQGRLLGREQLGLRSLSENPSHVTVDLSPDWQSAQLVATYNYNPLEGSAGGQTVQLQQLLFYRRQASRWLVAPPDDDFWGRPSRYDGQLLTAIFPQRDEGIVRRLVEDLEEELRRRCAEMIAGAPGCPSGLHFTLRFDTVASSLLNARDPLTPVFRQGDFVFPTPTLVGLPRRLSTDYNAFYQALAQPVSTTLRRYFSAPIPLPQEDLQLLCFPADARSPQLLRYDPHSNEWSRELVEQSFRNLIPVPGGAGIILQDFTRGPEAARLRLFHWFEGQQTLIFDEEYREQLTRPAGWAGSERQSRLLLQSVNASQQTEYSWVDLDECDARGCQVTDLSGFTVWSPEGQHTLVMVGTHLWYGDRQGRPVEEIGRGDNPFWLDDHTYGYVRYETVENSTHMEVVTTTVGQSPVRVLFSGEDLAQLLDESDPPLLFINYAAVNPGNPDLLLLAGTAVGAADGKYHIFSYHFPSREAHRLLSFNQPPNGYPSLVAPSGYPPFQLSPDGRWLSATTLTSTSPTSWSFSFYDLTSGRSTDVEAYYPAYPAQHPFYEWSNNGQWLAIVDDGFLRLSAPAYHYQRIVPYPFDACRSVAWTKPMIFDRDSTERQSAGGWIETLTYGKKLYAWGNLRPYVQIHKE